MSTAIDVTVRELQADPVRFDGQRVRFRGVVHRRFEGMHAGGAWWTQTGGDIDSDGAFLADVEGLWICRPRGDGLGHGHMGMSRAEIRASATQVSFDDAQRIDETALRSCPELTPLSVTGTVSALMQDFFWQGLELMHLGSDCRMPQVTHPHLRPMSARVCREGRRLWIASYEFLAAAEPMVPRRLAPEQLEGLRGGEYIEVDGELALGAPDTFPLPAHFPRTVNWPRLEGALDVIPPEIAVTHERYAMASVKQPSVAYWLDALAAGPRRVHAVGEVRIQRGDDGRASKTQLWATELTLA